MPSPPPPPPPPPRRRRGRHTTIDNAGGTDSTPQQEKWQNINLNLNKKCLVSVPLCFLPIS